MSTSSSAKNARLLSAALPPEERPLFDFRRNRSTVDYWINVHIGAAPLVLSADGRPPLESREPRALDWSGEAARGAALSKPRRRRLFMRSS